MDRSQASSAVRSGGEPFRKTCRSRWSWLCDAHHSVPFAAIRSSVLNAANMGCHPGSSFRSVCPCIVWNFWRNTGQIKCACDGAPSLQQQHPRFEGVQTQRRQFPGSQTCDGLRKLQACRLPKFENMSFHAFHSIHSPPAHERTFDGAWFCVLCMSRGTDLGYAPGGLQQGTAYKSPAEST